VEQRRFAAMHCPHLGALVTTVTAENWSGTLHLRSMIDGEVTNGLVERYRALSGVHLDAVRTARLSESAVLLAARTGDSGIALAVATRDLLR
jgi:alpha,alpha-trehalase